MHPRRWTSVEMLAAFVILVPVSQHASAVDVYKGHNFLLLCEFPTFEMNNSTATWSRSDLSPSLVHQRQQTGDELKGQNQLYRGRTSMTADALETGDLSMNLMGLTLADSGTYTCSVRSARGQRKVKDVQLQVKERFPSWATILLVLLMAALLLAGGLFVHFRQYLISVYKVEVAPGAESVLLPCKTLVRLPPEAKVVWTCGLKTVYANCLGVEQSGLYRGRTEINLSTDLSLTLKFPADEDSECYTCTASDATGRVLLKKQVELKVKVYEVEVDSGRSSVQLNFTTTHLPADAVVEWKKYEPEYMMVHTHPSNANNSEEQNKFYAGRTEMNSEALTTGDLTLTLRRPGPSDTGRYVCAAWVANQQRVLLRNKTVLLNVRGQHSVTDPWL